MVHQKASQAAWLQPLPVRRVLAIRRLPFNQSSAAEHLPPETSVVVRLDFWSRPAATSLCCTIYFACKHGRRHRLYFEDVQHSGALPKARLGRDYDLNAWSIEATCSFLSCLGLGQTARRGDSDYQSAAQSSTIHGPSSCYTQSLQQCHRTNPAPGSRFTQLQEHNIRSPACLMSRSASFASSLRGIGSIRATAGTLTKVCMARMQSSCTSSSRPCEKTTKLREPQV